MKFVFDKMKLTGINKARMEHLASLPLDLEGRTVLEVGSGVGLLTEFFEKRNCRILSTDARKINVEEQRRRFPNRHVEIADLSEAGSHDGFGAFDVVFCYGTLYHLSNPALAIKDLATVCKGILLLETCVWPHDNGRINPVAEPAQALDQSVEGVGCRPARDWVLAELKKYFPHVYITATQPDHPDFPLKWPAGDADRLSRSVFVASRKPLNSQLLVEELPDKQLSTDSKKREAMPNYLEGYLFDNHKVRIDGRAIMVGGSWQGAPIDNCPTAWDMDVIRFFYNQSMQIDNPVMLDIGANTGSFCLLPSVNPDLSGYAFEPTPAIRRILANNIALNNLQDKMKILPMAVSQREGLEKLKFPKSGKDSGFACLGNPLRFDDWDEIDVPVTTLDRFAEQYNIEKLDLVKIDTEGCELNVLKGGEGLIREYHPILLTEFYEQNTLQFGYHAEEIKDLLFSWGYQGHCVGSEDMFFYRPKATMFPIPPQKESEKDIPRKNQFQDWIGKLSSANKCLYYRDQTPESLNVLVDLVHANQPTKIVELGTLTGLSLRAWLCATTDAEISAIDLSFKPLQASQRMIPIDLSRVRLIEQNALNTDWSKLWGPGDRVLFYFDAHDLPDVPIMNSFLRHAAPSLPAGSRVIVDDIWFSSATLDQTNAETWFHSSVLGQIDELQCFEGCYAPYWKGGSFFGFAEVLPLLAYVNSRKIELSFATGGKSVWFDVPPSGLPKADEDQAGRSSGPVGKVTYHPLAWIAAKHRHSGGDDVLSKAYEKAMLQYAQGDLTSAVQCLSKVMQYNRELPETCYGLAAIMAKTGEWSSALKLLRQPVARYCGIAQVEKLRNDIQHRLRLSFQKRPTKEPPGPVTHPVTLFTVPKPFAGHIDIIQRNAIQSWMLLEPRPEILLLGDEEGVAAIAEEFGLTHLPDISVNKFGTPLLDSIFDAAQSKAANAKMAYVNTDIILLQDFMAAVGMLGDKDHPNFFAVGKRWDLDLKETIDFQNPRWDRGLIEQIEQRGDLHASTGIDYFIFAKGSLGALRPFALGRTAWDNWLIDHALENQLPVVDASQVITAIHQNHDYHHLKGGKTEAWHGIEAKRNLILAGGYDHIKDITCANWVLTGRGLRPGKGARPAPHPSTAASTCASGRTRFSMVMIVLNGMPFIECALASVYEAAHEIIIVEGAVEACMFSANPDGSSTDGTVACIESFPDPQHKIKLIQGRWPEKCEMQNKALEYVTGDYVWLVDSDEVYRNDDIAKITAMLTKDPTITQINFICHNFWKGFDHIFVSNRFFAPVFHVRRLFKYRPGARFSSHRPPTMVYPDAEKTTEQMHCVDGMATWRKGIAIYHYSYVLDAQVRQKMELYRRYGWDKAWEIDMQRWYNEFYAQWTPGRRLELESDYPIWTADRASYSVPFKGAHPEAVTRFLARHPALRKPPARPCAMRHVVDAVEASLFRNLPGPPLVALETGTIRSYEEKHESTRHISRALGRGGKLISIDINPESIRISRNICKNAENVEWVLSDSLAYLRGHCPETLHFVLLDSVNDPETIFSEFVLIAPHMAPNGIVIVDDAGILANGSGYDGSPARKGHRIWHFLKECGATFDVLETVPGHSTQIKVGFSSENARQILARIPSRRAHLSKKPASLQSGSEKPENIGQLPDAKAIQGHRLKSASPDLHIVVDGVIFQLQAGRPHGISRVWRNLMRALTQQMPNARISVLRRDGFPVPAPDAACHTVPAFEPGDDRRLDADDEMLRRVCGDLEADVFLSTYYTRAPGVVNVVMIHDMIPELFGYDLRQPEWAAKQRVIETADAFICVSRTTQGDLLRCCPQTGSSPMVVVPNGLDPGFASSQKSDALEFRRKLGLAKDYVLLVGNRRGYKRGVALLKALSALACIADLTVLCVGGERQPSPEELKLKDSMDLRYLGRLTDSDLAAAYSGAQALLVPSRYEGFGLPVIEAMACGCPVIAETSPAVAEVGGDAVYYADLSCPDSIDQALQKIGDPTFRSGMIARGQARAARFDWDKSAKAIGRFINALMDQPPILLTAVVSTYNASRFIQGCLDDLVDQTIADRLEIIVVDSASEENEAAVVRDFQRRHATIKYIRTLNREPVYQAWNRGIKFAKGKYISNANTDDRHRQDAFEQMIQVLEADDTIALVYADVIKTHTANETFRHCTPAGMFHWYDWDRGTLLEKGCFIGPQPVWRKAVHREYGYFDETYEVSADFEFWLRISQTNRFNHLAKPLGLYLDRPDSIEHANAIKKETEDREIRQRYRQAAEEKRVIGLSSQSDSLADAKGRRTQPDQVQHAVESVRQKRSTNERFIQGGHDMHSPETIYTAIKHLVDDGYQEAALWAMGKLLADFPENAQLHNEMAMLAYAQTDMQTALLHFKQAAALDPKNTCYLKNLGDYYYVQEKDAERALMHYEQMLALDPTNGDALVMAGHVSVSLHRYSQAQGYYQRVLDLDPQNMEIRRILEKMSRPALDQSSREMSVDDLYDAAQTKVREGDRQTAISLLEQLLARDDTHAPAHNDLGVLQYESGNLQASLGHYEKAAGLQPENETFQKNLADFYLAAMGDPEKAMQTYVQVLKLNPRDVEALLCCGQVCMSLGKIDDARVFIQAALETEPWNENAQHMLRQLDQPPQLPGATGTELYERAKAKASEGDLPGAIDNLSRYVAATPDNANAHNDLGVLYFEAGEKDKAVAAYAQAVKLEPHDPTYMKNLADFYLIEQGRAEEAMALYLRVLEKNPQDIESLIASGMVCASLGKVDDAKLFYGRVMEIEPWNEIARKALNGMNPDGAGDNAGTASSAVAGL